MAVMEVSLPSGFTVDPDSLPSLQSSQSVKRVETKDGDTVVMLYFDKVPLGLGFKSQNKICLSFLLMATWTVKISDLNRQFWLNK